jgi:MoaA/NifB/PqqE/SkfB family radical SAM enzyme
MLVHVELSITTYCQARCPSCLRTSFLNNSNSGFVPKHISLKKIKKMVDNLKHTAYSVELCGELGDPLMHPHIEEIINLFTSNHIEVSVSTNGGLRSDDFYRRLAKNELVTFYFGIDGMDSETNQKYRVDVDWDRAWRNMHSWFSECRKIKRINPAGFWNFIIFDFNKHQIKDVYQYAKEKKIPITFKLNTRPYGYVGDQEYQSIKETINGLK